MCVPLCQASFPGDSCAIYLIITALFQVGEEPPPAPEDEVELGMLAGPGPFVHTQQNKPAIGAPVLLGIFQRPAMEAAFACPAFMHHLHLGAAPGVGPTVQVWAPCRLSVITASNCSALPIILTSLQSKCSSSPPHLPSSLPTLSAFPFWTLDQMSLTDFRWLFGTANCPSNKPEIS